MENQAISEQPLSQVENTANVNEQIINEEIVPTDPSSDNGSDFGKFKDATSLLNAYNNLEKEFTKKSQKLSELTKLSNTQNSEKPINNTDNLSFSYKKSSWQTTVNKFFDNNPDAKNYKKEIAEYLLNDKHLASNDNCLDYAYAAAKLKNSIEPANLLNDPNYLNMVLENENVKNIIISNYLKDIISNKKNIKLISGEPKSISPTQQKKPKTIKEASMVLSKLLQQ